MLLDLVMLGLLHGTCDGFLQVSFGGQLVRMDAEQGNVICKHFYSNAVLYRIGKVAAIVLTPVATPILAAPAGLFFQLIVS